MTLAALQPFLAVDPLIAIGIAIVYAIIQALSKKKKDTDSWDEMEIPREQQPSQRRAIPPPVFTSQKPTPPPVAKPRPARPVVVAQRPVIITQRPHQAPSLPPLIAEQEGPTRVLAHLEQSQESYQRASTIQQSVQQRMAAIDRQTVAHKPDGLHVHYKSSESLRLLEMFRRPETVKQALMASFVLNPPKALE